MLKTTFGSLRHILLLLALLALWLTPTLVVLTVIFAGPGPAD
jgi:hypothetical protein